MIDICYCGNKKVFEGAVLSALSIAKCSSEPIKVYFLTADITYLKPAYIKIDETEREFMEKTIQKYNSESSVCLVDASKEFKEIFSEGKNMNSMYTPYAFLRLLMDQVPGLPDRILYLDVDTVALKDVAPLFHIDLHGKAAAVVHDSMRGKGYFNSGVIVFDLDAIKKEGLFRTTREYLSSHTLMMPDQDAFNKIFKDRYIMIPRIYNEQRLTKHDTVIRHYCQSIRVIPYFHIIKTKPWERKKFASSYKKDNNKYEIFSEFDKVIAEMK